MPVKNPNSLSSLATPGLTYEFPESSQSGIIYRLAVPKDAPALASLHYQCANELEESFMASLGRRWLKAYYEVILAEPVTVIVGAFSESDRLIGFSSGSIDCAPQLEALRKRRMSLLTSALPAIAQRPRVLFGMLARYRSTKGSKADAFILTSGPRADFLAWEKSERNGGGALSLLCAWYAVMRALKSRQVYFEVDAKNTKAVRFHKLLGAKEVRSFQTADHKARLIMQYPNNSPEFKTGTLR